MEDPEATREVTPKPNASFPTRLLVACACLTLGVAALGGFHGFRTYQGFREIASNQMRLMQLNGEIMLLDEVLTMSARMSAATGDARWQRRYEHYDPILVAKIEEAIALAPEAYGEGAAAETSVANERLVAMERRAFGLVNEGKLDEATAVLFSADYGQQKKVYAQGMSQSRRAAEARIARLLEELHTRAVASLAIGLAFLVLLGACWALIARLIGRHLRARADAEHALQAANATLEVKVQERTAELAASLEALRSTQNELMAASRRAGMADVASAVLHNVGNVLNSVNVSSSFATELVRGSKLAGLSKACKLLGDHVQDLPVFLTHDARGKRLPEYLRAITQHLEQEQRALLEELESLQHNVDHIKTIVSRQQEHARDPLCGHRPVFEPLLPAQIADEAIDLVRRSCETDGIVFERAYEPTALASIDRHKALQIVVNLLDNARQALGKRSGDRSIKVAVRPQDETQFTIMVEDNGCGIDADNVPRLFQQGFSTKAEGHGLGLHASACMAEEIGGVLAGESDGPDRGARFTLRLPLRPAA